MRLRTHRRTGPGGGAAWRRASAVLALLVVMIGPSSIPVRAQDDALTLRVGYAGGEQASANFLTGMDSLALRLSYDGLAAVNWDGTLSPEYAESWTVSPDQLTWTFKIRPGMKWSDGEPADATDAAFSLDYVINSIGDKNELWTAGIFKDVATGASLVSDVSAPDPLTLVMTTTRPLPNWLRNYFIVLPEHIWKDVTYEQATTTFQADPPIVGTGPFVETKWDHGQSVRLTRNEYYWGQKPALTDILIVYYNSEDSEAQALLAGEIDLVLDKGISGYDQLASAPNIEAISVPAPNSHVFLFNTRGTVGGTKGASTDAVADPAFRDAIGYAIDNQALVDKVYNGHAKPGVGLIPYVDPSYTGMADIVRHFDLAEAARRLDAAGYVAGPDGVRVDKAGKPINLQMLVYPSPPELATDTQFVAGWLDLIGIKVTPIAQDAGAWIDTVYQTRGWDLTIYEFWYFTGPVGVTGIASDSTEPPNCVMCWRPSEEFVDLENELKTTMDEARQRDIVQQIDRIWYGEAPFIVLAQPDKVQFHRTDKFTGWIQTPAGTGPYAPLDTITAVYPFFTNLAPIGSATPAPSTPASAAPSGAAATASPSASGVPAGTPSDGDPPLLAVGIVAVVAVAGGALWMSRRRAA